MGKGASGEGVVRVHGDASCRGAAVDSYRAGFTWELIGHGLAPACGPQDSVRILAQFGPFREFGGTLDDPVVLDECHLRANNSRTYWCECSRGFLPSDTTHTIFEDLSRDRVAADGSWVL